MILVMKQKRKIEASPGDLFAIISNPDTWPKWSEKVTDVACSEDQFIGMLRHRGNDIEFSGRILEARESQRFLAEIIMQKETGKQVMKIQYDLVPVRNATKVVETVTFEQHVPFLVWLLTRFLSIFGEAQGETSLERLERLVRDGATNGERE